MTSLRHRLGTGLAGLTLVVGAAACGSGDSSDTAVAAAATEVPVATTAPLSEPTAGPDDAASTTDPEPTAAPAPTEPAAEEPTEAPAADEPTEAPAADEDASADEGASAEPAPAESEPATAVPDPEPQAALIQLPVVEVHDLIDRGQVGDLNQFAEPGATLLWFWAPH